MITLLILCYDVDKTTYPIKHVSLYFCVFFLCRSLEINVFEYVAEIDTLHDKSARIHIFLPEQDFHPAFHPTKRVIYYNERQIVNLNQF